MADEDGSTPLHLCASHGHPRCTQLLLTAGADLYARDAQGRSAHFSALPHHLAVARLLVDDDPRGVRSLVDAAGRSVAHALLWTVVEEEAKAAAGDDDEASEALSRLSINDEYTQAFHEFVGRLHELQCPVNTGRMLMFGAGQLTVFEELAGVVQRLTPGLELVLSAVLMQPKWRTFLVDKVQLYPADVQQFVADFVVPVAQT